MNNDKARPLVGVILLVLSVLLVVGINTFAGPCGVHDDGSVSSCFWAARAVTGVGVVLCALSLVRVFERDEGERRGLCLAITNLGVLVTVLPGTLISLCMMETMRCHTIMYPFSLIVGALITVVAGVDLIMRLLAIGKARR